MLYERLRLEYLKLMDKDCACKPFKKDNHIKPDKSLFKTPPSLLKYNHDKWLIGYAYHQSQEG